MHLTVAALHGDPEEIVSTLCCDCGSAAPFAALPETEQRGFMLTAVLPTR
jgi:hypothetical protein